MRYILPILFLLAVQAAQSQKLVVIDDLSSKWLKYEDGHFEKFDEKALSTIYLNLKLGPYQGYFLYINAAEKFRLFIDGKLQEAKGTRVQLNVDSMAALYGSGINLAIHFPDQPGSGALHTQIVSIIRDPSSALETDLRAGTSFRDFTISSVLFILLALILVVRVNPRLAHDYFSFTKLLSIRESDENQNYNRLTGLNLLYFVFVSLSLSLFLLIIARVNLNNSLLQTLLAESFISNVVMWLRVAAVVLIILVLKGLLTYGLAYLFGYSDISDFHIMNFLRVVLFLSFILTMATSVYFIVRGQRVGVFTFFYNVGGIILIAWTVLMYFKMSARTTFSPFHLFSYLCATELVTLIVLSKVLYQ